MKELGGSWRKVVLVSARAEPTNFEEWIRREEGSRVSVIPLFAFLKEFTFFFPLLFFPPPSTHLQLPFRDTLCFPETFVRAKGFQL